MKKIFKERLLKMAQHLETGILGHKKFCFEHLHITGTPEERGQKCGTLGCAMGECPIVFPRHFEFKENAVHFKQHAPEVWFEYGIKEFFGINWEEVNHLFYPTLQDTKKFGGRKLGNNAKRTSVARNIREFVARQK